LLLGSSIVWKHKLIGTMMGQLILGGNVKNAKLLLLVSIFAVLFTSCSSVAEVKTEEPPTTTGGVSTLAPYNLPTPVPDPTCVPNPPPPIPSQEDILKFSVDPKTDWIKGSESAPITIVEYGDFQCPYCSIASQNLMALLEQYPEDVKLVYRHFPLASIHPNAILATQASEAAGLQGEDAFWAMHDLLYATQEDWSPLSAEDFGSWLIDQAADLGLEPTQFETDLYSEEITTKAEAAWTDGQEKGLTGTPYIRINIIHEVRADPQLLSAYVEMIKLESQQFTACPPMTVDSDAEYQATIKTEKGDIVIDLFPDIAPLAVNSFIFLAENGWFDGNTFHLVLPGFFAQTGDPTGTGYGGPGYTFSTETSRDYEFDRAGLVGMVSSGPDRNGSQFFITYDAIPDLTGGFTIFGEVSEGMNVLKEITPRNPQPGVALPPGDVLLNVTVEKQ
jgi:cyclophilin family peptidyl-prolyl cis-trans isomerase/protein-disulfide isomerase